MQSLKMACNPMAQQRPVSTINRISTNLIAKKEWEWN